MASTTAEKNFPFIVLNGPKMNDPSARRVIRKQAMKDIGESRRKRGGYGRVNMRQIPVFEDTDVPIRSTASSSDSSSRDTSSSTSPSSSDPSETTELTDYDELVPRETALATRAIPTAFIYADNPLSFAAISLFSKYETARAKFNVDLADLSILTNFNVGKSTIPILSADPTRLANLLGHQQWSYLQFVPSLYGSSPCVTAATNCVLAKVKTTLAPQDHCKEVALRLYAKALRSLQTAISNEAGCLEPDVLAATQLLSLHELLDPSRDAAWAHHISGSARLVKYRTPKRFTTEFEKAMFAAHAGPIMSECLVGNTHCYLEEPEWMELYRSLVQDSDYLHDRSSLTIGIRAQMFPLPGLWHDVGEAVSGPSLFDDHELALLERRCRHDHRETIAWMDDYKAHCVRLSLASPPPQELAMRRELFGAALECLVIIKRLLSTVCDAERETLEAETQALAHLILDLQKQPSPKHSWLFSGHEVGVAYSIMVSKDQWEAPFQYDSEYERKMAIRTRYNTWSNLLRMTG